MDDALNGLPFEERPFFDASYPDLFGGELASHYANEGQLAFLESQVLRTFPDPEILDHGCGFGLWMSALERRGWRVAGLDLDSSFLKYARTQSGVHGVLIQADARKFQRPEGFDVVLSMGGTWGSFERQDAPGILANLHASLRRGGEALFQLVNPVYVRRYQPDRWWYQGRGNLLVLEQQDLSESGYCSVSQLRFQARADGIQDVGRHRTRQVYYGDAEMRGLLDKAGFKLLHVWGDLEGSQPSDEKMFLVFHCRRA
ncbi:MAG: class I SAM-dependent methyltransferase [Holophagaceae bacterium]|nr:class I SAM-dependent methyltransferase [Holophagaceae bacterium]